MLWHHLYYSFRPLISTDYWLFQKPLVELANGGFAVAVFIMLSAMVMTYKTNDETSWSKIIIKRYLRLMVPCSLILIAMAVLWYLGAFHIDSFAGVANNEWLDSIAPLQPHSIKAFVKALLLVPFGMSGPYLNVLWMLNYLFFAPFIIIALQIATRKLTKFSQIIFVLACCIIAGYYNAFWINIFWGYILVKYVIPYINKRFWWLAIIAFFIAFTAVECISISNGFLSGTIRAILLVSFLACCAPAQKIFSIQPMLWLGKISFEVYLWHMLCIFTVAYGMHLYIPYFHHKLIVIWIATSIITILISWIWNICVNRYANKGVDVVVNKLMCS